MNTELIFDSLIIFFGIFIEATPFVLLGVFLSAFIACFVKTETFLKLIPKGRLSSTLVATLFGFFFPVCECGNIPVARRLILKKVPPHVAITFLLAAPVFNPIVILATMAAFPDQPEILWLRIGFSVFIAVVVGLIFSFNKNPEDIIQDKVLAEQKALCSLPNDKTNKMHSHKQSKGKQFVQTFRTEFFEMMTVLTIGAFIASIVQLVIPRTWILGIGQNPVSSVAAMMLLAVLVSICSNVDAFFALSFTSTFTSGSILAFLVFGPMIDIKAWIMLRSIFKVKTIIWITLFTAQLAFLLTLFINLNF
jgi:uncharacterized membrane protein YraQ (UPF0718 family)